MTSFKFSLVSVTVHFIILLSSIENINCQVDSFNCFAKNNTHIFEESWLIDIELNSDKIEKALYYLMMNGNEKCNLYVYAKVFDQLLNNGLDLEFDISKTPSVLYNSYFLIKLKSKKIKNKKYGTSTMKTVLGRTPILIFLDFKNFTKAFEKFGLILIVKYQS